MLSDIYRVGFIGHREINNVIDVENKLYPIIQDLIMHKEFVEFYLGRNGEFDIIAASVIRRVKKEIRSENSVMILVLPYSVADMEDYINYYDEIVIPEELFGVHYKSAIKKRNEWLVDKSDLLISFIEREKGGAYQCVAYANKKNKAVKNIAVVI